MKSMKSFIVFGFVLGLLLLIPGQARAVVYTIDFIETSTGVDVYKNGALVSSAVGEYIEYNVSEFIFITPAKYYQDVLETDGITLSDRVVWDFGANGTLLKFGSDPTFPDISGAGFLGTVVETGSLQYLFGPWSSGGGGANSLYVRVQSDVDPVPEPGTMMLLGSGLVGLAGWGRKKFRK